MTKLYLDDIRTAPEGWVLVTNYNELVAFITQHGLPEAISFDHDLADEHHLGFTENVINYESYREKTGYDCAKWLFEYCLTNQLPLPKWQVHSRSIVGARNIEKLLSSFG
jgi:hypothetical protein